MNSVTEEHDHALATQNPLQPSGLPEHDPRTVLRRACRRHLANERHAARVAPDDDSYHFSNAWRAEHPNSKFLGYDRGHMCMKQHGFRISADADWNTHTLLNACPQRADLNQGIWLDLEKKSGKWADKHGRVWIITGPVIYSRKPLNWLGQAELGEVMVAIPDAFFKIVVRPGNTEADPPVVLAFICPQHGVGYRVSAPA